MVPEINLLGGNLGSGIGFRVWLCFPIGSEFGFI